MYGVHRQSRGLVRSVAPVLLLLLMMHDQYAEWYFLAWYSVLQLLLHQYCSHALAVLSSYL